MESKVRDLGHQLYATMPYSVVAHYADQKQVGTVDLCIDIVIRNPKWAERLFDEDTYSSLEDRIHDFVGLVNQDEYFVPKV
tara:strand:+ start:511 stop:753 length:243 start_codon:yes stop_codon:yes gene_type:complete